MANTIQSNILRNRKDYSNFGYFLTGVDVTDQNLDAFSPYLKGRGRLWFYKVPPFMAQSFGDITTRFKKYLEAGYTKVDGIQDISADFVDFEGGFNGQKFSNISQVKDESDTMSISLYEQSGSPVREFIETWLTGVRDPRTGIAHYHGASTVYSERNHTGEFVYYVLDPTGKQIEYACLFAHCIPTKVPKDHYNYEKGDVSEVLLDLEFKAQRYESVYINQLAIWHMQKSNLQFKYLDFNPATQASTHTFYTPGAMAFGITSNDGSGAIRVNTDDDAKMSVPTDESGVAVGSYSPAVDAGSAKETTNSST